MKAMPVQTGNTNPMQVGSEDSFFVLRDCRELFQCRLVEIAKQAGIYSASVIEAFSREVGEAHDELATSAQQDGFEQTAGLTASRITLVGNDDLELDIRIGEIAHNLQGNERIEHWRAQSRYMTLLHRPQMSVDNNPVGFETIRRGLLALCKENGESLDKTFDRLNKLEEKLQLCLPDVYSELNELLEHHHVAPAPSKVIQRESTGSSSSSYGSGGVIGNDIGNSGNASVPGNNAFAALQQAIQKQSAAEGLFPSGNTANLSSGIEGNFTLNASTLVILNQLMERLRVLELQQITGLSDFSLGESTEKTPLHALKSKDLDLPLGTPAAVALDTLSLIFEAIFVTPDLPDVVKAAIGRLQIPLLRLAILDASFFSETQHPARRLINRMAHAAIGLAQDTGRDHPLCARLVKLADAARTTLETNNSELSPLLDKLDVLITERDELLQTNSQPYVQLIREHETLETSRLSAQSWLKQTLGKTAIPEIQQFLSLYWVRVMQAIYSEVGTAGEGAKKCDLTIQELLWSVQPKKSADERKQLLTLIPSLLKRINAGLDSLDITTEERAPFLNTCFELQTASLRNRPDTPSAELSQNSDSVPVTARSARAISDQEVQILEHNGKLVQYLGLSVEAYIPIRAGTSAWKEGDWIIFALPDGERLCGRLCWQGSPFGTVLLFNAEWGFAVALAPSFLEQQLRGGQARVVSESALFDDAAKRALSQIAPL